MRKLWSVVLGGILLLGLSLPAMSQAEDITIVGTGDGTSVLASIGKAFSQANAGLTVVLPDSIGSGGGIKAVGKDEAVIGRVVRKLKEKEAEFGLTYVPVFRLPTVFFVNTGVSVEGVTSQQIVDIYSGKITNWKDVGGSDAKIRVVRREEGDSSLENLVKTFPGFSGITITEQSKTAIKTGEMVGLVNEKADAVGFGPLDVALENGLKALKIDGKGPTDAGYPSFNTVGLVFKEANKQGNVKKFIEFATSPAALEAVTAAGGLGL